MIVQDIKCPNCGGPQNSKPINQSEWDCEYCQAHLIHNTASLGAIEIVAVTSLPVEDTSEIAEKKKETITENRLFTTASVIYLLSFLGASICLFYFDLEAIIKYFTFATNLYVGAFGFMIAAESEKPTAEPSSPTVFAVLLWFIANIFLMFWGFPLAIVTRIAASFAYMLVGLLIGGTQISLEVKKVEKI